MIDPKLRIILDNLIADTYVHFIWRKRLKTRMKVNFLYFLVSRIYGICFLLFLFSFPIVSQKEN